MTRVKPLTNITNIKNHNLRNRTNPLKFEQNSLNQFFSIYNARLATSCDFLTWRILNEVGLPIKDKRDEKNFFLNTIKDLSKKEKWSLQEITNNNENVPSQWIVRDVDGTIVDELCNILPPSVYPYIFRAPEDYYRDASAEFKKTFSKFFNERNNWDEDNFDPLFKEITKKIDGCFWNWGEACSLASSFRKESYPRKPDFWLLQDINRTIQETVYEEASGRRDSKFKMDIQLIFDNLEYLQDGENLSQQVREVEIVLFQAYETRLKVCIMDQPGFPLFRARKVFDLMIPYRALNDEMFVLEFVHSLWLIRQNIIRNAMKLEKIGQSTRRNMQKAPINPPGTSSGLNINDYPTFPSP
ncbi:9616_t:CDS:2 [Gigaspora margarita]|uniref:9616_t:CDS:1 n=1 Tax=Gigaspora margarita TaxID=4874 RepID=A0ABN7V016_GIGMA|nr:9616_t:CDS:2 [Gigaspora margarita]